MIRMAMEWTMIALSISGGRIRAVILLTIPLRHSDRTEISTTDQHFVWQINVKKELTYEST
jgi:hypothetical protein